MARNPALEDFVNIFNTDFKGQNVRSFAAVFLGEYLDQESSLTTGHLPFYLNCNLEVSVSAGVIQDLNLTESDLGNCTVPYRLIKHYQEWKKNYPHTANLELNDLADYSYGLLSYENEANLRTECERGDKNACYSLGYGYYWHLDTDKAIKAFAHSCSLDDPYSCNSLGNIYQEKEDFKKAGKYYDKACTLNLAEGCFNQASLFYLKDYGQKLQADFKKAATLYKRSCDLGFDYGCLNLGVMYGNGHGVEKDLKKAFALYDDLCKKGNATACGNLGKAYINGEGVAADKVYGLTLEKQACDSGDGSACLDLGNFRKAQHKDDEALLFFNRACELGQKEGCQNYLNENR
ncbi:MAG: sel1 repeat family protein [Succinivibrio sp.]|nr:sel1 repeat family protein [Succinivibrio sp.]